MELHKLLEKQLKRHQLSPENLPTNLQNWQLFIKKLNQIYKENDEERYLLERATEISSKEMQALNEELRLNQHIARLGSWQYDPKHNVIIISKELQQLLGSSTARAPLDEQFGLIHEEDRQELNRLFDDAINRGIDYEFEARIKHTDGTFHWFYIIAHAQKKEKNAEQYIVTGVCMDITQRKEIEATLESFNDGILLVDSENYVLRYNQEFIKIFDIPTEVLNSKRAEVIFNHVLDLMTHPEDFSMRMLNLNKKNNIVHFDKMLLKNGQIYECFCRPYQLRQKTIGYAWNFHDMTHDVQLEDELKHQATHDALTNLPNRLLMIDRLQVLIASAKRNRTLLGILFLDVDRFKLINDSLSHAVGDQVLIELSKRLLNLIQDEDTLVRLGGDEFVLIVPSLMQEENLISLANKILQTVSKPFSIMQHEFNLTISIGICVYPEDGKTSQELLRNADLAMYRAKEDGGNQFQFYSSDLSLRSYKRLKLECELHHAIKNNEFVLHYQPIYDTIHQKIVSVEALIRWDHPTRGLLLPDEFVPIAEDIGLIVPIGLWVLETACSQNKNWQDLNFPSIKVAVNVATAQLKQSNFPQIVQQVLIKVGLEPDYLEIEIGENVFANDPTVIDTVHKLKKIGVNLVLDDFGTGNPSFLLLRATKIDRLKIDKRYVQSINVNVEEEKLVSAILKMAEIININVTAEGIETKAQLDFFPKSANCDLQGFYMSKPLPVEKMFLLLKDNY